MAHGQRGRATACTGAATGRSAAAGASRSRCPCRAGPQPDRSADIETTAYATLALDEHGDASTPRGPPSGWSPSGTPTAASAPPRTPWSPSRRSPSYAADSRADVDLTVTVTGDGDTERQVTAQSNFDVLQMVERAG